MNKNKNVGIQNFLIVAALCGLPLSASAQSPPSSFDAISAGCFHDRGQTLQRDDLFIFDPHGELTPTTVSITAKWQRDSWQPAEMIICE